MHKKHLKKIHHPFMIKMLNKIRNALKLIMGICKKLIAYSKFDIKN